MLERALASFPPGTFHLAVVDPGVGTDRLIIIAEVAGQTVVCPNNGLITWATRRLLVKRLYELTWRPAQSSTTFHGRDVMAPAVAMLMEGRPILEIARPINEAVLLDLNLASDRRRGQIIHIDTYGSATTNLPETMIASHSDAMVIVRGQSFGSIRKTYGDVGIGEPLALIGSSGLLEIAVRDGSAAAELNLRVGDDVGLR
jgi:S-adenosylmethionine hydrolase